MRKTCSSSDFRAVFKSPSKVRSLNFKIFFIKNRAPYARLGVSVPKRLAKLAVVRNKVKRLIRESFRANSHVLGKCDFIVILAGKKDKNSDAKEIYRELNKLWIKVGYKKY